jgi:predicted small secreted protein
MEFVMGLVLNGGVPTTYDELYAINTTIKNQKTTGPKVESALVLEGVLGQILEIETGLTAPITVSKYSGAAGIVFGSNGTKITVSLPALLASGSSMTAVARAVETDGTGVLVPVTLTGIGLPTPVPTPTPTPVPTPTPTPTPAPTPTPTVLSLSSSTVVDNAAQGTVIGTVSAPAGYTVELADDVAGMFQLVGDQLQVGSTPLVPGWEQPSLYASRGLTWSLSDPSLALHPIITVNAVASPGDVSGLVRAWRSDEGVTLSGDGETVVSVAGAWGTSVAAVGAARGSTGQVLPKLIPNAGPNGKPAFYFQGTGRSRFDFTGTGPMTNGSTMFVVVQSTNQTQTGGLLNSTNGLNRMQMAPNVTAGETWHRGIGASVNNSTAGVTNSSRQADIRGLQIFRLTTTGTQQLISINGAADVAVTRSGTITECNTFGGFGSGTQDGGSALTGFVTAILVYDRVLTASEVAFVERCLTPLRTRELYFSTSGNDANNGFSISTPKLDPRSLFTSFAAGAYRSPPGTRLLMREGDRFNLAGPIGFPGGGAVGARSRISGYNGATGVSTPTGRVRLSTSESVTTGWTAVGDGTFTRSWASAPIMMWLTAPYNGRGLLTPLVSRATSTDYSFAWSGGTLTIRLAAGIDPNSSVIEIANDVGIIDNSATFTEYSGLEAYATAGNQAFKIRGASTVTKCVDGYGGFGDFLSHGSSNEVIIDCKCYAWGPGAINGSLGGTNHDAFTVHQSTNHKAYMIKAYDTFWHGNAHQTRSTLTMYGCEFWNSGIPFYAPNAISDTGGTGTVTMVNCLLERAADAAAQANAISSAPNQAMTISLEGCHVRGLGAVRGFVFGRPTNAASNPTHNYDVNSTMEGFTGWIS